ncbi:MAG: amino acid permease [Firmicutes bacterium]|nr:amino acid permease [Bacillota bacterium]
MNSKSGSDTQLLQVLGRRDVLFLAFGSMIGWGWVVLAGDWINDAGSIGAVLAFLLGGLMVTFISLTYGELTSAMPKAGGEQVFSWRALGPFWSFVCAWMLVLAYVAVVAFEAVAMPTVLEYLVPAFRQVYLWNIAGWDVYLTWALVGSGGAIIMMIINYIGIKFAAIVQTVVVIFLMIIGVLFFGGALVNGQPAYLQPTFVGGMKGILTVAIMTPFMLVGFDIVPQAAEEMKIPSRTVGIITIMGVILGAIWYMMIILAVSFSLPAGELSFASLVTADAMGVALGHPAWSKVMVVGGLCGIISTWNGFYIGGSRVLFAMARAGQLPAFLGYIHPKYKTPSNAVILVGVLSALVPFLGRMALVWLTDAGGLATVIAYFIVAVSFLVLRFKEPEMERPYKVFAGKAVGFIAAGLAFIFILFYLPGISPAALIWPYEWGIIFGWIILGAIFFIQAKKLGGDSEVNHRMRLIVLGKNTENISSSGS